MRRFSSFKRALVIPIAIVVPLATGYAGPVEDAETALEPWQPVEVRRNGATLIVQLPQRRITLTIYEAVMVAGLCPSVGMDWADLGNIEHVCILNSFNTQGFVFEGGQAACKEIAKLPIKDAKGSLLGHTHAFSDTAGRSSECK